MPESFKSRCVVVVVYATLLAAPLRAQQETCIGDCARLDFDGDGQVTIDELMQARPRGRI